MSSWKLASTVILAASASKNPFNYRLLLLQRISTSSSFPNALVFPGGTLDQSDYSTKLWAPILNRYFPEKLNIFGKLRLPMYDEFEAAYRHNKIYQPDKCLNFSAEVVFRLCALRETFEETGILLARNKEGRRLCISSSSLSHSSGTDWQHRVKNSPESFAELYSSLNLAPDLMCLHEWASWLTPYIYPMNRRFDTVFYFSTLPVDHFDIKVTQDYTESVKAIWETPLNLLTLYHKSECQFFPPQVYELGRLCHFMDLRELELFAEQRGMLGSERWTPIVYYSEDGSSRMLAHPGDQRYLAEKSELTLPIKMSSQELDSWIEEDTLKNRLVKTSGSHAFINFSWDVNVERLGHKRPVSIQELNSMAKL